jgi:hypothetical protein
MEQIEGTGFFYWTASGSYLEKPDAKWRRNITMRIIARTFEEVVAEFRCRYPTGTLHNVDYKGEIHALLTEKTP